MPLLKNKTKGALLPLIAGALALAAMILFLVWAPGHNAAHPVIPIALAAGIAAGLLFFLTDVDYLGLAATAGYSIAFFTLLSDSVGSFVDAFQGIVMFGDATQVGIILVMSGLMCASILLSILACFAKRRK